MMIFLRLGKPNWQTYFVTYANSGNLLDQSFEVSSEIKFSLVTTQKMSCFVINSS